MKSEKFIILGQSGSGKSYLVNGLINLGEKYSPKFTTRPMREGEKNGVDYNFLSNSEFEKLLNGCEIKVYQTFLINDNTWYYGITKENYDNNNVFIMTPDEFSLLKEEERKRCFVIYIDIDEDTRRNRLQLRNDNNDSIERRIEADKEDFKNFTDYDLRLTDPEFEVEMVHGFAY
jgi:guanylate kinase